MERCINASDRESRRFFQQFSRSSRFAFFCNASKSIKIRNLADVELIFVKIHVLQIWNILKHFMWCRERTLKRRYAPRATCQLIRNLSSNSELSSAFCPDRESSVLFPSCGNHAEQTRQKFLQCYFVSKWHYFVVDPIYSTSLRSSFWSCTNSLLHPLHHQAKPSRVANLPVITWVKRPYTKGKGNSPPWGKNQKQVVHLNAHSERTCAY